MTDFEPSSSGSFAWVTDPARFHSQRSSERFQRIVTLARIVNSLRFTDSAAFDRHGDSSPAASRQRAGAFLYLAGILYEGLQFADRLGAHFREDESFKNGIQQILSDPAVKHLRSTVLNRLRNQAIYHHDDTVFADGLAWIKADEIVFVSGSNPKPSSIYYDTADLAVLRYALQSDEPSKEFLIEVSTLMIRLLGISNRFAIAADMLIVSELRALGWTLRRPGDEQPV